MPAVYERVCQIYLRNYEIVESLEIDFEKVRVRRVYKKADYVENLNRV